MHKIQWSPERPLPPPVSLTSQSHREKPPEVTCTSRGNPGFPDKKIKEAIRVVDWEGHLTGREITMGGGRLGRRGWVLALGLSKVCRLGS